MPASYKSSVSFGLIHIPVSLYTAVHNSDIHFNQLCKNDGGRIKYKKICSVCNKDLEPEEIIKGYEYDKDKYITVNNDDLEMLKTKKDKTIHIYHFTGLSQISPVYFEKSYHVIPEPGAEKAFELLRKAMITENKVAIAKTVMSAKEKLIALISSESGILAETLAYFNEIKEPPFEFYRPETDNAELQMAKFLIGMMEKPFSPELYRDEYQKKVRMLINAKIEGNNYSPAPDSDEMSGSALNISDALRQSLKMQGELKK